MHTKVNKENGKNVVITLDPELVEKAHKLGLNISKVCENALIQAVKALEAAFNEKAVSYTHLTLPTTPYV